MILCYIPNGSIMEGRRRRKRNISKEDVGNEESVLLKDYDLYCENKLTKIIYQIRHKE